MGVPKAPLHSLWAPKGSLFSNCTTPMHQVSYIDPNPSQKRAGKEKKREKKRQGGREGGSFEV